MAATFQITGIKEIQRKLKALDAKIGKTILRQSFRTALKPVAAKTKELAPKRTGLLSSAVKVKAGKRKKNSISVVVQIGAGDYKGKQFYASFLEYGLKARKLAPREFMKKAFEMSAENAKQQALQLIKSAIDKAVKGSA